jgi:tetratricopeptide (TPR) repeat protein
MTEQLLQETSPNPEQQVKEAAPWYSYIMPVALGAFYLLFLWLDFSYANMTRWPWAPILSFGLLSAAGWGIWQLRRLDRPFRGLGNGLDWAALLWVIALVASTIFSHVPHRSHWYLVMALSYIAGLYALSNWLDNKNKIENLTIFLVGSSLFFSCNSLYQYLFKKWLPLQGKTIDPGLMLNSFPLGHQNFVAGFLVLTLPVAAGIAFHYKDWRRWLGIGTVLLGLWDMVSTGSRGGFIGLGVALILSIVFTLINDWSWKKVKLAAGALLILLSLIGILISSNGNFRYRIGAIFTGQDLNILSRNWAWGVGLREWQENPWFGVGLGANPYTFKQYATSQYPWSRMLFQQLHNSFIQVIAELGSLGGLAILATVALIAWLTWKLHHAGRLTLLSISIFCGFAGYGIISLTDYQLEVPAISLTLALLTALLVSLFQELPKDYSWPTNLRKGGTLVGFSLVAITSAFLIPVYRALYESEKGFEAYHQGNIPVFYNQLVKANYFNPSDPYYPLQLSLAMQEQGLFSQEPKSQEEYYRRGAYWAEIAAQKISINYTYENAGWAFVHLQKYEAAEKFFKKNLAVDPVARGSTYLGLSASLLQQTSKKEEGIEALAKYLFINPDFFRDKAWDGQNSLSRHFLPATEKLIAIYDKMLANYPEDIDLLYNKAMVYYIRKDYVKALFILGSIPYNPRPISRIEGDGMTYLPYSLASTTIDATKSCLRIEKSHNLDVDKKTSLEQLQQDSKLQVALPAYDKLDLFIFRHSGGLPTRIIWPILSDQRKFSCGVPSAGLTRLILPKE